MFSTISKMSVVPYTGSGRSGLDLGMERHLGSDYSVDLPRARSKPLFSRSRNLFSDNSAFDDVFESSRGIFFQMDRMMGPMMRDMRDPFGNDPFFRGGSSFPDIPAIMGGHSQVQARRSPLALTPFGSMLSSLTTAPSQFPGAPLGSQESMSRDGSCHSYSSSSVMTMSAGADGRPQIYQASSSTRAAPGGVRETRRSVMDSNAGVRKMAIGHHINDRAHVIEKEMNRGGDLEERQELINLDEEETPTFDKEFRRLTQQAYGNNALEHRPTHRSDRATEPGRQRSTYLPALPATSSSRRRNRPMLAITSSSSRY